MEEQRQTEEPKIKKAKVVKVSAQRKEQFRDIVSNVFAAEHTDNINYPDLIEKINRKVYELQIALILFNAKCYSLSIDYTTKSGLLASEKFSDDEVKTCLTEMEAQNAVMVADDQVFLI